MDDISARVPCDDPPLPLRSLETYHADGQADDDDNVPAFGDSLESLLSERRDERSDGDAEA